MAPFALALAVALASPGSTPSLDPGPFRGGELAVASAGALGGDVLVVGAGYATLQLFANGTFAPTAENFRRAAYGLGVAALVVPPLTAVLLARLTGREFKGSVWKGLLLAAAGQVATFTVGYLAAPHFWVMLPVQLVALSVGTSLGLHWGPSRRPRAAAATTAPAAEPDADPRLPREPAATRFVPLCPDAA
jgi:hypothetical protein